MDVSSDDYAKAQGISRMITGEPKGEKDETPRPRKKKKLTCKKHRETRAQASAPQISLPSPSASERDVIDK